MKINKRAHQKVAAFKMPKSPIPPYVKVGAIADTGAQTCTAGTDILNIINGAERWLLKTKHRIKGVNNSGLSVKGALIVDIRYHGKETTQVIYVCENVKQVYISQTALKDLDIIGSRFPHPNDEPKSQVSANQSDEAGVNTEISERAPCGCLKRTSCPRGHYYPRNYQFQQEMNAVKT